MFDNCEVPPLPTDTILPSSKFATHAASIEAATATGLAPTSIRATTLIPASLACSPLHPRDPNTEITASAHT
jgi:hypothetical protein